MPNWSSIRTRLLYSHRIFKLIHLLLAYALSFSMNYTHKNIAQYSSLSDEFCKMKINRKSFSECLLISLARTRSLPPAFRYLFFFQSMRDFAMKFQTFLSFPLDYFPHSFIITMNLIEKKTCE